MRRCQKCRYLRAGMIPVSRSAGLRYLSDQALDAELDVVDRSCRRGLVRRGSRRQHHIDDHLSTTEQAGPMASHARRVRHAVVGAAATRKVVDAASSGIHLARVTAMLPFGEAAAIHARTAFSERMSCGSS